MATIRKVAERARVSIGTVDRVIHRRGKVSKDAEERVRAAIEELGYRPNLFARNLKLKRTLTIGALMPEPEQDGGYWEGPVRGIDRAAASLAGHQVEVAFFHHDRYCEASLRERFAAMLAARPDALLIAPVFPEACGELLRAVPASVPFVFFDSDVPAAERLSYIGQDPQRSGRVAAQLLSMTVPGRAPLGVIRVLPTDYHIEERVRGFRAWFDGDGERRVTVHDMRGDGGPETFDEAIATLLASGDPPGGLFVTNARTYRVARAVKRLGGGWRPRIVGYDLIEDNVALLRSGEVDFLISQDPDQQGFEGVQALYRHLALREEIRPRIAMPLDIVTRENIDSYRSWTRRSEE